MESDSQNAEELAQKRLDLNLSRESISVRSGYLKLLFEEQSLLRKNNHGKPVDISAIKSEELLEQAKRNVVTGGADPKKMETAWERATSRKGRPPIGGAQDD
jgi:hypothetical protein